MVAARVAVVVPILTVRAGAVHQVQEFLAINAC